MHSQMVDKEGVIGVFKLKFTPVGVGASTTRIPNHERLFHSQKLSVRFNLKPSPAGEGVTALGIKGGDG